MTTKKQDSKGPVPKPEAKKAPSAKAEGKKDESIGFLRAAEKAHIAVMDIPLDFFADLGMFPERVRSTKDLTRRFIGGMYNNLDSVSAKINNAMGAPGRFVGGLMDKLQEGSATPKSVVRPKPEPVKAAKSAKGKSVPKKAESKAKAKTTAAKAKGKAKAKPKAKDASAKPKAIVTTPSRPNATTGIH